MFMRTKLNTLRLLISLILSITVAGCGGGGGGSSSQSAPPPGTLDTTFGTGGIVKTAVGISDIFDDSVAIQSDGKIVSAGSAWNLTGSDFALARHNTDGTLDTTFGTGGIVTTATGTSEIFFVNVAIQSDGKIVAAGDTGFGLTFVRYNSDGSFDTTFGTGGVVTTAIGDGGTAPFAIQSDGKIVAAVWNSLGYRNDFTLVRYETDGTLDTTFGTGGLVTTTTGSGDVFANSVAIQSDGKIISAGSSAINHAFDFALGRHNTDGSLDTTFGTDGIVTTTIGPDFDAAYGVVIQSDGKIVVTGTSSNVTGSDVAIVRYNTDGSLDTTFGTGGIVAAAISAGAIPIGAIQSDGKIIVAGTSPNVTASNIALARYNTDGSLDTAFGTGGIVTTATATSDISTHIVVIEPDGKIVAAGTSLNCTDNLCTGIYHGFDLLRYWP
jgi:uncharacterized delta-60 repeat protein